VVVAAIQIMLDQFQRDASEKQKALQNSINELTGQVREHKRNLAQAQSENEELQSTCELQESEIEDLQETITIQNTILARQQRQLQSLLGNTSDDEQS
jgi:peptidoglycan hydrolase CwlO-like protein